MERFSAAVVGRTDGEGWFFRKEIPTVMIAFAIYLAWLLLVVFAASMPWWVVMPLGGYVVQWQFSLQHEAIHGWRSLPAWLRTAIVWPPLGLWFPFELYRRSHSQHHRNVHLTFPGEDTETFYHVEENWDGYGRVWRLVLIANQTLLGRVVLGPLIRPPRLWINEVRRVWGGGRSNLVIWARHFAGVAVILWFADLCGLAPWRYLLAFAWPGVMFGMLRSFIEHRWGERPSQRTAVVESNWIFGLLFLWNNLHAVHHTFPTLSWFRIPRVWREHRERIVAHNGGYVFEGYWEIARRWFVRPVFIPVHPPSAARRVAIAGFTRPTE